MKKRIVKLLISSLALFSMIACTGSEPEDSSEPSSSAPTYYTVIFKNWDESVLREMHIIEGHEAKYTGKTPEREFDGVYIYTFVGWDKAEELKSVTTDLVVYAVYDAVMEQWSPIYWD